MSARDELATVVHRRICEDSLSDCLEDEGYCVKAANEILAAGYSKPRTITTAEELVALPNGTVVMDGKGEVARKLVYGWRVLVSESGFDAWLSTRWKKPTSPQPSSMKEKSHDPHVTYARSLVGSLVLWPSR